MAKLYFKYGAMGSSKSAQALITQFNYEELGMTVWLIKPSIDDRDGANIVKSRVGLMREAEVVSPTDSIRELYSATGGRDVIIADEAQFFTPEQIDELRDIVDELDVPVLCFGLRTDFLTHMFPGSKRLLELADSITEIKTVCACGAKATVNARLTPDGRVVTEGERSGLWPRREPGSLRSPIFQLPCAELMPKVRPHCTKRSMGSRSLPKPGWVRPAGERASSSSKMALTTARRSPRTPAPLLLKAAATRAT